MTARSGRPSLARATGVMAAGTALSRLTGFGRNIALAIAIGQNDLTDSYNLANTTPNIIYELLLGGVLSATLVPLFVQLLAGVDRGGADAKAAWHDISAVVTLAVVASVAATLAFLAAAPLIVDLYFGDRTADQRAVGTTLVRMFALQVVAYGAIAVTTALLNARRRFAAPMFAPIANNLVVIAVIVALPQVARSLDVGAFRQDGRGLAFLGLGTTLGVVAMALVQMSRLPAAGLWGRRAHPAPSGAGGGTGGVPAFDTSGPGGAGLGLRPVWDVRAPAVRRMLGLSGWTLGVVVANQLALLVVLRLPAQRGGGITAYLTALVFFLLPHGVYAVSVITALQPDMAERWAAGDAAGVGERVATGLRTITAVIVPAGVGLALVAGPLVRTLLLHGRFDAGDARLTATTLTCFALGLPGFSSFLFLTRVWQSMQDTRTMFGFYVLENGVNIVLAVVLFPRFGVPGLAAAYGASYTIAAAATLVVLARRLPGPWLSGIGAFALRLAAASAAMAAAVALALLAVGAALPPGSTRSAVQLAVAVAVGGVAFLAAAALCRLSEVLALVAPLTRAARAGASRFGGRPAD